MGKVLNAAIDRYGGDMQVVVCIEEMSELTKELTKSLRGHCNREHIAEEIADVQIMLEQMTMLYGVENSVKKWQSYKLDRLQQRLESETQ